MASRGRSGAGSARAPASRCRNTSRTRVRGRPSRRQRARAVKARRRAALRRVCCETAQRERRGLCVGCAARDRADFTQPPQTAAGRGSEPFAPRWPYSGRIMTPSKRRAGGKASSERAGFDTSRGPVRLVGDSARPGAGLCAAPLRNQRNAGVGASIVTAPGATRTPSLAATRTKIGASPCAEPS